MENRDYNREFADSGERKYAYGFDFRVMHPLLLRSFRPFFRPGNVLELGCFMGDFTTLLRAEFEDVTAVEASEVAIDTARKRLPRDVKLVNSTFETTELNRKFDNVILSHVLEHVDAPVEILQRINSDWLSDNGRLFLVCPNANAPSRQLAVRMGVVPYNAAVTSAERDHGHRRTYAFDTLERDARSAGLDVMFRTGVFFKAFANFQWDRILETDIVTAEYLDACFRLGQIYPDLCASILLVCGRG
jgi:2-polyprenyl-3-methyl-5-hydroxy-6-metoxy-1,4-benzoquinol methylase